LSSRNLAVRAGQGVPEVELKHVPAGAPFDAEGEHRIAGRIAVHARSDFADDIDLRGQPRAPADADEERVAMAGLERDHVVHPHRRGIDREPVREMSREDGAQCRGMMSG
jgi:hypothetical protein